MRYKVPWYHGKNLLLIAMRARGSPHANMTTLGTASCAPPLARGCVVILHLHKSAGTSLLRPLGVHGSALECSGGLYHCDAYLYTQTRCLMAVEKRPSLGGSGSWAGSQEQSEKKNQNPKNHKI